MLPTGFAQMTYPPKYHHKCNKCGCVETPANGKCYPVIEYDEVTPNVELTGATQLYRGASRERSERGRA